MGTKTTFTRGILKNPFLNITNCCHKGNIIFLALIPLFGVIGCNQQGYGNSNSDAQNSSILLAKLGSTNFPIQAAPNITNLRVQGDNLTMSGTFYSTTSGKHQMIRITRIDNQLITTLQDNWLAIGSTVIDNNLTAELQILLKGKKNDDSLLQIIRGIRVNLETTGNHPLRPSSQETNRIIDLTNSVCKLVPDTLSHCPAKEMAILSTGVHSRRMAITSDSKGLIYVLINTYSDFILYTMDTAGNIINEKTIDFQASPFDSKTFHPFDYQINLDSNQVTLAMRKSEGLHIETYKMGNSTHTHDIIPFQAEYDFIFPQFNYLSIQKHQIGITKRSSAILEIWSLQDKAPITLINTLKLPRAGVSVHGLIQMGDMGWVVAGETNLNQTATGSLLSYSNAFIAHIKSNGQIKSYQLLGGAMRDRISLLQTNGQNIYAVGLMNTPITHAPFDQNNTTSLNIYQVMLSHGEKNDN